MPGTCIDVSVFATAELIDAEVRRIVEECQGEARYWKSPASARPERAPRGRKATPYKYAVAGLHAGCSVLVSPF